MLYEDGRPEALGLEVSFFRNPGRNIFSNANVARANLALAVWSSGMIPASGAGGPGFDSRNSPSFLDIAMKMFW